MVTLEDAIIARYGKKDKHFEILVDPKAVEMIREGKDINIFDYLATDLVFKDARKGDKAADESLKEIFHTDDVAKISAMIIREGEIQLTTKQRKDMQVRKRKEIVDWIARSTSSSRKQFPPS